MKILILAAITYFYSTIIFGAHAALPVFQVALSDLEVISYLEAGQFKGINYEIVHQIETSSGLKFKYELYPHARLAKDLALISPDISVLLSGLCDTFSNEYEKSAPLYHALPTIYLKKTIGPPYNSIRVGRARGTCGDLTRDFVKSENVVDLSNLKPVVEMLEMGRLDGICSVDVIMDDFFKKEPKLKDQLVIYKKQSHDLNRFESVICRKKSLSVQIKSKLDRAIKKLRIDLK